jgi:subtilase family serine protease
VAASTTRFYLSVNVTLEPADTLLEGTRAVPGLAPGATNNGSASVTIPGTTATGSYYVIAQADGANVVAETYETNNTRIASILIGPDLTVSALTAPATVAAGGSIRVTDTVRNQGGGAAGASATRFYLSTNVTLDAGDVPLQGARMVPALAVNGTSSDATTLAVPGSTAPGNYFLIAQADGDGAVGESRENNNLLIRFVTVQAGT